MTGRETKSVFDIESDAALEARLDAQAEADVAVGRVVPHARVVEWLKSWGAPDEQPCPTSETP